MRRRPRRDAGLLGAAGADRAGVPRPTTAGARWYQTGDIVTEAPDGNYTYLGRRDRMVKRRGYRVELGEIEAALYRHPAIKEAAVVAMPDEERGREDHRVPQLRATRSAPRSSSSSASAPSTCRST